MLERTRNPEVLGVGRGKIGRGGGACEVLKGEQEAKRSFEKKEPKPCVQASFVCVQPGQSSGPLLRRGPTGFMLCCCHLEILNNV